jgi:hypothetical protein
MDPHQERGDDCTEHIGNRNGNHEEGNCLATVLISVPMSQIHDDCREKSGFGRAQKKAYSIELGCGRDQARDRRECAPHDQTDADKLAGAPHFSEHCSGDLKQNIAEEENPSAESRQLPM